jgi:hypothetical protein
MPSPLAPTVLLVRPAAEVPLEAFRVCPECAGPLARASGCVSCVQCGWGRCG